MRQKLREFRRKWQQFARADVDFHFGMLVILGCSSLLAWAFDVFLLHTGMTDMIPRYLLAITFGYGMFFLITKFWFDGVLGGANIAETCSVMFKKPENMVEVAQTTLDVVDVASHASQSLCLSDPSPSVHVAESLAQGASAAGESSSAAGEAAGGIGALFSDEGGIILLALGACVAAVFGVEIYLVYYAPDILSESLYQYYLSWYRPDLFPIEDSGGWMLNLAASTIGPYILLMILGGIVGMLALAACPEAVVITQALAVL